MQKQRKHLKVYRDEIKERFTTHWDLDYLSTAELEAVMAGGNRRECPKPAPMRRGIDALASIVERVLQFRLRQ